MFKLTGLLAPSDVIHRAGATDKRHALTLLAEHAARAFGCEPAEALDALTAREAEGSTGVGNGVALPHACLPNLTAMRAVFMRLEPPVPFDAVDDRPVDLIFALFAPVEAASEHLRTLARVSRLLRRPDLREQLRLARSADALYALLAEETRVSAA